MRSTSSPLAVSMMIGTVSPAPRRRRQTDSPSSPGSIRSSTTRCGGSRCSFLSMSRASGERRDLEALLAQIAGQQVAQAHVVVDDEDLGGCGLGNHVCH